MTMEFDPVRVRENARKATTEDLLDRVTVYRSGMEPAAVEIIEGELQDRGIYRDRIRKHADERREKVLLHPDGIAIKCSNCYRPAIAARWGWHWLSIMAWGKRRPLLPLFPRYYHYCELHCRRLLVSTEDQPEE
jgi:hypothetical protein